ncbi:hypothetical protein BG004_003796 [Podila humilis]|nr:hypothetical protein BG004_003796 [Podila humilis]
MLLILEIPHILRGIIHYLSAPDLAHLARVNHEFHTLCIPLIWSTISINHQGYRHFISRAGSVSISTPDGMDIVDRHQHHVKTLDTNHVSFSEMVYAGEWIFPNLHTLRVQWGSLLPANYHRNLCYFAQAHVYLTSVDIRVLDQQQEVVDLWIETIETHKTLQHIRFKTDSLGSFSNIQRFIHACSRMITFNLHLMQETSLEGGCVESTCLSAEGQETTAALVQLPETQWRDLSVHLCPVKEHLFLVAMISKSPRLKTLDLRLSPETVVLLPFFKLLISALESALRLGLRRLCLRVTNEAAHRILATLEAADFPNDLEKLVLLGVGPAEGGFAPSPRALISQNLTSITIKNCLTVHGLADIAVHCSQLKTLQAHIKLQGSIPWTEQDVEQLKKVWHLPKLEVLHLLAHNLSFSYNDPSRKELNDILMDYCLLHIGKQKQLKELSFQIFGHQIMNLSSVLDRLRELSKLKFVDVFRRAPKFGIAEAEFVMEYWKNVVAFRQTLMTQEATDLLLAWRPWLKLDSPLQDCYWIDV